MNDSPRLHLDARIILEAIADGLAFAVPGVVVLNLPQATTAGIVFGLSIAWVFVRRLLGQKTNAIIEGGRQERDQLVAERAVFVEGAPVALQRKAAAAGAALDPAKAAQETVAP